MTPAPRAISRGIAWTGLAGLVMGALDVAATLLLLRYWLTPAEYGVAAIATTLFPMFDLIADAGFAAAVVQRDDSTDDTLSSAFWAALACSASVALALLGLGPLLGWVQGDEVIGGLIAAYGAKLLLQNAFFIPNALLRRELRFGAVAGIRVSASVAELAAKLIAAAAGLGVWCFLIAQLAKAIVQAVLTQVARPFRPRMRFRRAEATAYWRFGARTSASQVLFHLYSNADYQIVGYAFGPAATGLYRAAYELVLEPAKLLSYMVVEVAFPVFSRLRHDAAALRAQVLAFTRHNLLVLVPVLSLIAAAPAELLELCFGATWRPAADAVRLLCVVGGLRALSFLLPPLLDGLGRAELTLRYTMMAAIAVPATQVVAVIVLGDALGWRAVALAWAIAYPLAFVALVLMALRAVELPAATYARAAAGIVGPGLLGLAAALAIARVLPWVDPGARVVALAAVIVAIDGAGFLVLAGDVLRRSPAQPRS